MAAVEENLPGGGIDDRSSLYSRPRCERRSAAINLQQDDAWNRRPTCRAYFIVSGE